MEFDTPLDFAAFQLSPRHSRCELFVSSNGNTEKLASGLVKPFMTHLKVVEEQVALSAQLIKLEADKRKNVDSWFTKGTFERFVRFVSTPEILELVITYDAEMSQLEAARRIYSQGSSDQLSSNSGDGRSRADATKKELLRAIDVRLTAVKQDLSTACARAAAAGFNHDTVSDLQLFADKFGATRLNEACCNYISLYERRPELCNKSSKSSLGDEVIRSSYTSDMSIDDDQSPKPINTLQPSTTTPATRELTTEPIQKVKKEEVEAEEALAQPAPQPSSRRLSVQDRINMFENKQKEVGSASGSGGKPAIAKPPELRRLSSDVSNPPPLPAAAVLRRWSGASDMSIDLTADKKETDNTVFTPTPTSAKTEVQKSQPDLKDQVTTSSSSSSSRVEDVPVTKVETVSSSSSSLVRPEESVGSNQPTSTLEKTRSLSSVTKSQDDATEVRLKPPTQIKSFHGGNQERSIQQELRPSSAETSQHHVADAGPLDSDFKPITKRVSSKNTAPAPDSRYQRGGSTSKFQEAVAASQHRGLEIGSLRSQPKSHNNSTQPDQVDTKDYASTEKQFVESGVQKVKVQKKDESSRYVDGYGSTPPSAKFVQEGSGSMPLEQTHRPSRQLKGNQELNDELKLKANELEKLFAEHKLRGPGDQPNNNNNARRTKPSDDDDADQNTPSLPHKKQVAEPVSEQKTVFKSPVTRVDELNHRDALQRSFSEVSYSDGSRGKLYDSYMKKREEKLREQWGSNKSEKEARMKAMHDSLERSSAEMKAKLSLSADRQDSVSSARRRAERLRSFNSRSAIKREQPLDFGQLEDDEDLSELKLTNNGVSRGKKSFPVKNSSASTPRTPAVPRSAAKVASGSGRRRVQSDNPLVQSVPNFSELRKESIKPYSVATKAAARSQLRNSARSRSTNEDMPPVKEEKPGRSQSLRKNSPTPPESSEGEGVYMKPKSFHRKNNSIGGGIGKMKASLVIEAMKNEQEEEEYEPDVVEDDDEEEFDTMGIEAQDVVHGIESKNESLMNSESGNGNALQMDPTLATELPASATSMFAVQDSPGESPMSWNSHTHHPFSSYTHEASDNDASVESWNLNTTEADVARMRKKWGTSTQKHLLVANSSSSGAQSRKDMTKGFKRLLKFGRKSRGTDNMADWISATTSEGDDDTEDGRDLSNRSSEDLRKSRMGYSQGLPFEGSFNETDYFSDQVQTLQSSIPTPPANFRLREDHLSGSSIKAPRSFFSLSSFRSKGSDSKPR